MLKPGVRGYSVHSISRLQLQLTVVALVEMTAKRWSFENSAYTILFEAEPCLKSFNPRLEFGSRKLELNYR